MRIEFPEKVQFLFRPAPYKILFGGRDGIKSWSMARALLVLGAQGRLRWLCARETQQSIAESVHHLLEQQITNLGLQSFYRVEKARIVGTVEHQTELYGRKLDHPGVSEFVFAGLKHNVNQIKSFEALDGVWVEEAANVSKNSWEVVLPTIRKEGSEIWASFNPELPTDDTYVRWVVNPPPGAVVVRTSYMDNIWLSETSRARIEALRISDPDTFEHVYGGATKATVAGAIYRAEIVKAEKDGRICRVPYDRTRPVDVSWDLGYADRVSMWFTQAFPFEYRVIDYYENDHQALDHYLEQIQARGYIVGTCVFPWDGGARHLGTGRSIEELTRAKGFKARVMPQVSVADGINAVRTIFPQLWFDAEKCSDGLQYLRRYQWGPLAKNGVQKREPLHDGASHPADALRTMAMWIRPSKREPPKGKAAPIPQPPRLPGQYAPFG